jgi:hypothetical protein
MTCEVILSLVQILLLSFFNFAVKSVKLFQDYTN